MLTVRKVGSIIEKLKEMLEEYLKKTKPKYYPPVENLLDLVYEHYTENNSIALENTVAGKVAKEKEKELETWLRGLPRMDEMVEDYGIDIPLFLPYCCVTVMFYCTAIRATVRELIGRETVVAGIAVIVVHLISPCYSSWNLSENHCGVQEKLAADILLPRGCSA